MPTHGANKGLGESAASGAGISELVIGPNGVGTVGIWGGGPDGAALVIKVYRGATVVSEGAHPAVKLQRISNDSGTHIQVYSLSGLKEGDQLFGLTADGARYTGALSVRVLGDTANGVIEQWARHYLAGEPFPNNSLYPDAAPYLALSDPHQGNMIKLKEKCIGGPLFNVHGLSIHCTAGAPSPTPFGMAAWHCVNTWNNNGASAHFGIAGDGTVVQFIPTNFVANAQFEPGNSHWVSVEIDNNGRTLMNAAQLTSAKSLFSWVCRTFGVPRQVATGCLYPSAPGFDKITRIVCDASGSLLTTSTFEAVMSRGVSCHWWLDGHKSGAHVHACPGAGIIGQLVSIAKPGLVS